MQKGVVIGIVLAVVVIAAIIGYNLMPNQSGQIAPPSQTLPSTETNTQPPASANTQAQEGFIEARIENFAFVPAEIRIKAGSKITWINNDNAIHTLASDSGGKAELNSKFLNRGDSYGHVFSEKGVFNYHCGVHQGMKGRVVVE